MSEPATAAGTAPDVDPQPATASDAALARYQRRMRRQRTIYFAVVGAIVVALLVVVSVAWSRGETAHVTLHTVTRAPASLSVDTPSTRPTKAWATSERSALGVPVWGGTVVTYSSHTVRGRDARTGDATWSYTRSDRDICGVAQLSGTTVAVFENKGNCDELTALDSQRGTRRWTRTLAFDGRLFNGGGHMQVQPDALTLWTSSVIYNIDPSSGYNRWTYTRYGCAIHGMVLGSAGALISQNCANPRCKEQKFCGPGPQLLLRDGSNDRDDKSTTNPDRIVWNRMGNTDVPASADDLVSAYNGTTHELDVLDGQNGASGGSVRLAPSPSASAPSAEQISAVDTDSAEIVWISGGVYAITPGRGALDWGVRVAGPPSVVSLDASDPIKLTQARITAATATGIGLIDGATGRVSRTLPVAVGSGASVYPLGDGVLVSTSGGVTTYR